MSRFGFDRYDYAVIHSFKSSCVFYKWSVANSVMQLPVDTPNDQVFLNISIHLATATMTDL